ncbi:MAG: EamA family transporter [Acidobacteriota bacterium]
MNNAILYATTVLIWGSTWFAIEFQLGQVAPEVSIVYRYASASFLLFGWSLFRGLRLRFDRSAHLRFALLGLLLFCLNYVLAYRAQVHITSALTAITFSTILWMNIFNARLFFGVRSDPRTLVGAALGLLGIGVLFSPEVANVSLTDGVLTGAALSMSGAFIASLGNMASQAAQGRGLPIVQSNAWGMAYGALFTALIAAAQGHPFTVDLRPSYLLSLAYLSIFGSVVGFGAYLTLIGRIGAHRAGYATVAFPVVALILSALFEGLRIEWTMVAGAALVLTGNVFVLAQRKAAAPPRSPEPSCAEPLAEAG